MGGQGPVLSSPCKISESSIFPFESRSEQSESSLIDSSQFSHSHIHVKLKVSGKPVIVMLDTGASLNIISLRFWDSLGFPNLRPFEGILTSVNGSDIEVRGILETEISLGTKRF